MTKPQQIKQPIRVVLADDHPTLLLGLAVLLNQVAEIEVVAQVEDGQEALTQLETLQPNVAVLDCKLPTLNGVQITRQITEAKLAVRVLALSAYDNPQYLSAMMSAGASGYLLKDEAPTQIVSAIQTVARGEELWSDKQRRLIHQWQEQEQARWNQLTEREKGVLALVATGKPNKTIAEELNVTKRTVEYHLTNILGKLQFQSRLEAALWVNKTILNNKIA